MTFPYDTPDKEKTATSCSQVCKEGDANSAGCFPGIEEREEEAVRAERRSWIVPAILCLMLTAASFYYFHQKVARESHTELKVIRADASLRKAHLNALQHQIPLQKQEPPLAKSHTEAGTLPRLKK